MSERDEQIKAVRNVFEKIKKTPREKEGCPCDFDMVWAFHDAMSAVEKEGLYELKDVLYEYLNDPYPEFRADAVRTLGWNTRLGIDEFCLNDAPKIWLNDPDEEVRAAALVAWANYYSRSKNPNMLKTLYSILVSRGYSTLIRSWALNQFFYVSDGWLDGRVRYSAAVDDVEDPDEFDKAVDWERVHRLMKQYVPGWSLDAHTQAG